MYLFWEVKVFINFNQTICLCKQCKVKAYAYYSYFCVLVVVSTQHLWSSKHVLLFATFVTPNIKCK